MIFINPFLTFVMGASLALLAFLSSFSECMCAIGCVSNFKIWELTWFKVLRFLLLCTISMAHKRKLQYIRKLI